MKRSRIYWFVHNSIAHFLMGVFGDDVEALNRLHDWSADKAERLEAKGL